MEKNPETSDQQSFEIDLGAAWAESPDPILSSLSAAADAVGISITTLVGGAIVEGELVAATRYFEQEREALRNASFGDLAGEDKESVFKLFETILTVPDLDDLPDAAQDLPRRFLHLTNVSITGAGSSPGVPAKRDRLRVPIEKVAAWTLGRS